MVTAMLCRIHQSGRLDSLTTEAGKQVAEGIRIYKEVLRKHIPEAVPFYPLGMSDVTNSNAPVALGMRAPTQTLLGIWRLDGPATTRIPWTYPVPKLLYPRDLGINIATSEGTLQIEFPRTRMACLLAS